MKTLSTAYKNGIKDVDLCTSAKYNLSVFIRWSEWTTPGTPSAGFTELGTLDLNPYLPLGSSVNINLDIENDIQGEDSYGLIQASQFNLTLAEATERGDTVTIGELLQTIMLEAVQPYYQYDGDDVHLWELVVRLGDVDGTDYVEHAFIIEWLYDTTNDEPTWMGIKRHNPKFTITGFTLIKKLANVGTSEILFDMSNKSGVYYDDSEDEADNLEFTDVMYYPLYPYFKTVLKDNGIQESNITLEIPPDNDGSTKDFSTIDVDIIETPDATQKGFANKEYPTPYFWKTSGTKEYYVWITRYKELNICVMDTETGEMTTNNLNVFTGTGILGLVKRLWYPLTGDTFYSLCFKSGSPNEWYVIKHVLADSGEDGTADDISTTNTAQQLAFTGDLDADFKLHWLQTDFDTQANPDRLWAVVHDLDGDGDGCLFGYWEIDFSGSASWTTTKDLDADLGEALRVFVSGVETEANATGGLRVLYSELSRSYAMLSVLWYYVYPLGYYLVRVGYDESEDATKLEAYVAGGVTFSDTHALESVIDGNGTVGGFWKSGEDAFYFMPPSVEVDSTHYWNSGIIWTAGDISNWSSDQIDTMHWRSFASHGTVSGIECIYGIGYNIRSATPDYTGLFVLGKITGSSNSMDYTSTGWFWIADGTESNVDRKWPAMSSPALVVSEDGSTFEDHPFIIMKLWGVDADGDDYAGYFLTTYSENLWPQIGCDFESDNPSVAEFIKQVCRDYQLLANIEFAGTVVRPRNQTGTNDDEIGSEHYLRGSQTGESIPRYAAVRITCNIDSNDYVSTSGNPGSANVLSFASDFLIPSRCQVRANEIYEEWQYNQVMYEVDVRGFFWLEPGDHVLLEKVMPPGEAGYVDISGVIHSIGLSKTMKTALKVRSLNTTQLSNL